MEFYDAVKARFSCRKFLDKPVELDLLKRLVATAQRAPSWGNTQPWKAYAAAGEVAKAIRSELVKAHTSGQPETPDIPMPARFEGVLMDRYRTLGRELFKVLGITREDKDKRAAHYANNFNAFGAPCLVFFTVPAGQTPYVVMDTGAFVVMFCLAAANEGLGSCILAALARYPQIVRAHLPIPDDESLLIGVALGWPDTQAEVNRFRSSREELDKVLVAKGF